MQDEALNKIKKRIIDISYKRKLSHISSCITQADILYEIYKNKKRDDIIILSAGHSGLALYCVLEHFYGYDAEVLFEQHGVHPNRDKEHGIWASSGSLGHGIGIGVGAAIAYPKRKIIVISTDGEMMEGSCMESLRIADDLGLKNFYLYINANGFGGYSTINIGRLSRIVFTLGETIKNNIYLRKSYCNGPIDGLQGHYRVLSDEDYKHLQI